MSEQKYLLSEQYNIQVDVYIDEDGLTPVSKYIPDSRLSKEFLRLYFSGRIDKVWKDFLHDTYWVRTTSGDKIFLKRNEITASEIEAVMADKRGGRRKGTGPKSSTGGMSTQTMRIPSCMKNDLKCLIDIYVHWANDDMSDLPYKTDEKTRLTLIDYLTIILNEEKRKILENGLNKPE